MLVGGRGRALRELLIEAAGGCGEEVLARLGPFGSWQALVVLWDSGWLGEARRSARATSAEVRKRLRTIVAARQPLVEVVAMRSGAVAFIEGWLRDVPASEDFAVEDDSRRRVFVARADVRWVHPGTPVVPGERVSVLGFAEQRLDPRATPEGPRRLPRQTWVRAGRFPVVACASQVRRSGNANVGALTSKHDRGT